jgi:small GTP-binding protein
MKVKICLIGEAAVGKTSMIRRFVHNDFDDKYITTLGAKVSKKEMGFDLEEQDIHVDMDMTIWDIMGEKGFRDLVKEAFFIGTRGVLAVCDITRFDTLKELDDWVQSVFRITGSIPVVFAVNKVDLKDEVLLLYGDTELEQASRAFAASYIYTSAKTGENVEESFRKLGQMIIDSSVSPRLAK